MAGASAELKQAYYSHGYLHDEDMPELPCVPLEGECVDPGEELFKKEMVGVVQEVLNDVPAKERKVVCLRFGIGLTQEYTLDEIGLVFGVSRERIRQIEARALRLIKHPSRYDKLIGLIDGEE
jgi:RNA polymerase primary sigma factor